jgi:methionine synthase I (cobalamin-dependent)
MRFVSALLLFLYSLCREGKLKPSIIEAAQTGYLLLDGAMGTELLHRGLQIGGCSALWNLERPEDVAAVHQSYVDAGANALETKTF